jgi:hypothetical protein
MVVAPRELSGTLQVKVAAKDLEQGLEPGALGYAACLEFSPLTYASAYAV